MKEYQKPIKSVDDIVYSGETEDDILSSNDTDKADFLFDEDLPLVEDTSENRGVRIIMRVEKPTEEGCYFCQYHRNFEPIICTVTREDDGELWLHTRSTSKPLKDVKAYCFGYGESKEDNK